MFNQKQKNKLFVDFDGTICNSIKASCEVYNELYKNHKDFIKADASLLKKWNMKDQCPLLQSINEIFDSQLFFDKVELMDSAYISLKRLSKEYDIIVCSIGTYKNISLKSLWIKENLPFIKESIFLINTDCKMDKSIIDMKSKSKGKNIFIDDHGDNLYSSNADINICFGEKYEWNEKWIREHNVFQHIKSWESVEILLLSGYLDVCLYN